MDRQKAPPRRRPLWLIGLAAFVAPFSTTFLLRGASFEGEAEGFGVRVLTTTGTIWVIFLLYDAVTRLLSRGPMRSAPSSHKLR